MEALVLSALLGLQGASPRDRDTQERLEKLEEEVQKLKEKELAAVPTPIPEPKYPEIHFSGYGDAHLNFPKMDTFDPRADNVADLRHLVIGIGVDWAEWISMELEVDFESAGANVEGEFAYVDLRLAKWIGFRSGIVLMPVGSLNEFHEPPNYYSVNRPYFDHYFVETTWQELGAGFFGEFSLGECSLRYRVYAVSGLDPTGLAASDVLDAAQGHAKAAIGTGGAVTGRLEFQPAAWITLGTSWYAGRAVAQQVVQTDVVIATADVLIQYAGFTLRLEGGQTWIDNAGAVSAVAPGGPVARISQAWYAELGYDILGLLAATDRRLVLFARYEWIDTQHEMPSGIAPIAADNPREAVIAGAAFYLTPDVAFKIDGEFWRNGAGQSTSRLDIGIGFQFHIR